MFKNQLPKHQIVCAAGVTKDAFKKLFWFAVFFLPNTLLKADLELLAIYQVQAKLKESSIKISKLLVNDFQEKIQKFFEDLMKVPELIGAAVLRPGFKMY